MKKTFTVVLVFITMALYSQDSINVNKVWLKDNLNRELDGVILSLNDDSVIFNPDKMDSQYTIAVENIKSIRYVQKGKFWKSTKLGMLIGGGIGVISGGIIAYQINQSQNNSCVRGSSTAFYVPPLILGSIGVVSGGLIGGIIGAKKVKIHIDGDINKYNKEKKRLKELKLTY